MKIKIMVVLDVSWEQEVPLPLREIASPVLNSETKMSISGVVQHTHHYAT